MSPPDDWFVCPVCGAEVRSGALSCKECGSDDKTGWSPATEYDALDLPDRDEPVDYGRLGIEGETSARGFPFVAGVIILSIVLLILLFVLRRA